MCPLAGILCRNRGRVNNRERGVTSPTLLERYLQIDAPTFEGRREAKQIPTTSDSINVQRTGGFTLTSWLGGKNPGIAGKAALIPRKAIKIPKPAPVSERITLSVNSCLARHERLAPSAERMANSLLRPIAQAINNTGPTAPKSNASV